MNKSLAVTMPENADVDEFVKNISSVIIEKYENRLLKRITEENFRYFPPEDRKKIYLRACENAKGDNGEVLATIHYNRRRMLIEEALIEFFKEQRSINIEGFVNFRLEGYREELHEIVLSAADEIEAETEYEEFIEMLRFFISVQYPKEEIVHVVKNGDAIRVLNRRKKDITESYITEAFSPEFPNREDILLSALIGIAPEKIVVHDALENEKIYSTIKRIFPDVVFKECTD